MFAAGSAARCHGEAMPVDVSAQDLAYTKEDDAAIDRVGHPTALISAAAGSR